MAFEFNTSVANVKKYLGLIEDFKKNYGMEVNEVSVNSDPLLFIGVIKTENLADVMRDIEANFGEPYKRGGDPAHYANLNDQFIIDIGGVRTDQILYSIEVYERTNFYCAIWPWTSKPEFTSIRFGLIAYSRKFQSDFTAELEGVFNQYKKLS